MRMLLLVNIPNKYEPYENTENTLVTDDGVAIIP
jgi:hypothetical protein